jgi:hypothetical protein
MLLHSQNHANLPLPLSSPEQFLTCDNPVFFFSGFGLGNAEGGSVRCVAWIPDCGR